MTVAPREVLELVKKFELNLDSYRSPAYNEAQVRLEFINPLFEALGWDMANRQGYAEAYKEVIHEAAVKVGGATKAPDYAFRVGGTKKFFLEAKKPGVDIKNNPEPAYQLRRYAWSAGLPLSILTDFEEFAVYDCRIRPHKSDKANVGRILFLTYRDYETRWAEIANVFGKQAVLQGSFDRYAEGSKGKRGTSPVDDAFLEEIEEWREELAKDIAKHNPRLKVRDLNFAVQRTIDRIIFLRMCEDRGVEQYAQLQTLLNGVNVYGRLKYIYGLADDKYNSGLFHFRPEKDRAESPDELTLSLKIDDKVLKDIIGRLYYPESPYEFSVLSVDILGNVYEQFLGKVIRLTKTHQARIEEKPEVKKAGGVYYTPKYIVDYIVKNTVGKLCEGKTPKQIEKLRILDPACGSGSFLIGAYSYLLDYHRDWYEKDGPEKYTKEVFRGAGGQWYLTTQKKKEILLNNIYGVDIDNQAVEVTKLNLLLKVLEGETEDTLQSQMKLWRHRALPDLGKNIKSGNSLIGPDYYHGEQLTLLDDEEKYKINVFDWKKEFSKVISSGGFDVVIGNPPYNALLSEEGVMYLRDKFRSIVTGRADTSAMFVEAAKNYGAKQFGMLLPYRLLSRKRNHGAFQQWLIPNADIEQIIYLGCIREIGANDEFMICILRFNPSTENKVAVALDVSSKQLQENKIDFHYVPQSNWGPPEFTINIRAFLFSQPLLNKIRNHSWPLGEIAECKDGIVVHIRDKLLSEKQIDERYKLFVGVAGLYQLQRYSLIYQKHFLCYDIKEARKWIKDKEELRKVQLRDESIFLQPKKILTAQDSPLIKGTIDENRLFHSNSLHTTYLKGNIQGYKLEYVLGLLNSKVVNYYHSSLALKGKDLHPQVLVTNLKKLPIRKIDFSILDDKARHDKVVLLVEQIMELNKKLLKARTPDDKTRLQRQIDATDQQIDQLVYELFGLTEEEIAVVEGRR